MQAYTLFLEYEYNRDSDFRSSIFSVFPSATSIIFYLTSLRQILVPCGVRKISMYISIVQLFFFIFIFLRAIEPILKV